MSKTRRSLTHVNGNGNGNGNRLEKYLNINTEKKPEPDISLKTPVRGRTINQKNYLKTIHHNDITLCTGPAGSGKTHLAIGAAATYLSKKLVDGIILVRPVVSCDEELGFLPGSLEDKLGPYLRPVFDELLEFFTREQINMLTHGKYPIVEGTPLGTLKGRTFKRAFIILDEAQDATYKQLKTFLTRMGEGSKVVLTGDTSQSDRGDNYDQNPLEQMMRRLQDVEGVGFSRLDPGDIQRHPRLARLLECL